ncbi:pca operon transcription factor PcaQ [Jiella sp. MQZ9-1]|uniref:Pca operon transcription factor PcaQ n=1 Tax=Jiella flava TaxID=2816857 RepID=A0A939JUK0_9HYPH|nr:pca operon transcription factor PcaQ [Jiella flava]MBO0663260.1 pca operon transcription factor PcaQ [Jiella flava]MCD2471836.1 pca operon transcription factor PcaQ [Jiella flava]
MEIDKRIKIRHLRTFVEVARSASVGRAGERMHVSQPAVSKTLAELESILGARLMERNRSGVSLTPVGQMFHAYASSSLAALRQGIEGVSQTLVAGGLRLSIGALPSVAARIVPDAAVEMGRIAPEVGLEIVTGPSAYLTSELTGGTLDLIIGRLGHPEAMSGLSFSQLYSERISLVVRPGHPLVECSDINAIADYEIIFPNRDAAIRILAEQFFIAQAIPRGGHRIETVAETFGRAYVRKSDAVWVISSGVVALDVAEGMLVELPIRMPETLGPVGLTMRGDGDPSPALRLFMEAVRRTVTALHLSN